MRTQNPTPIEHREPTARPQPSPAQATDGDILLRLRNGDKDALEQLMGAHWNPLLGFVCRMLGSPDAAEDVAQETFVRLWQMRAELTPTGSPRALVYQIARNLVYKLHRHFEVRVKKEVELRAYLGQNGKDALEQLVDSELQVALLAAISALPDRRREAFVLLRYQGLSLEEAAAAMGLAKQTVANHAALAIKQLRPLLGHYREQ